MRVGATLAVVPAIAVRLARSRPVGAVGDRKGRPYAIFPYMLIGLTQHTTRCSDSPGQAREELSSAHSAVEAETELVQIGLKFRASAVVGSTDQVL